MKLFGSFRVWVLFGSVLFALFATWIGGPQPAKVAPIKPSSSVEKGPQDSQSYWESFPKGRVFPYSVIPGGVGSPEELRAIVKSDPEIQLHLKDFNLGKALAVKLAQPRSAYVSYRKGSHIYWTRKRVSLAKGELVITDGVHTIRGRCGNDVSDIPREPTSPAEPNPKELETPIPNLPTQAEVLPPPILPPPPPGNPFIGGPPVPPPFLPPAIYPPLIPPVPPGGSPVPPGPPVTTPEPSTALLFCAGAAGIIGLSIWRKPKAPQGNR